MNEKTIKMLFSSFKVSEEERRKQKMSVEMSKAMDTFVKNCCEICDRYGEDRREHLYLATQVLLDLVVMDGVSDLDLETGVMTLRGIVRGE